MDSLYKYPLYRAHKKQIEAEEKELKGDIKSAVELRKDVLKDLNLAFTSTSHVYVRRNLQLQINHEETQLKKLILHEKEVKKLIENLRQSVKEIQAEESKKEPSCDILENAEKIDKLLIDMDSKTQNVKEDFLSLTKLENPKLENVPHKFASLKQNEKVENLSNQFEDIISVSQSIKESHDKNTRLLRLFMNSFCSLKMEHDMLQATVRDMKNDRYMQRAGGIHTGERSSQIINISLSSSTPPSIVDLVPLETPKFDFLKS